MYFKQIKLSGFKSFADRTLIHLEPGITAIVGPNGCGKSNILDALSWALGEQSAKALRGSNMQDVIFNGSENRLATGMAEVTLTFDNADSRLPVDFAEVEVTRRVYRSGESEYLLNKTPCRLRDILELFMDTGIGTSAYSFVGQGKIAQILSSKPEDRRVIFEEAAGIIKYKSRKRIAMRKLEAAEHNLVRLNDIIAEIQRQMRSLKRQVNAAVRYREYTDSLRELELRSAWLTYSRLTDHVAELREAFTTAQDEHTRVSADVTDCEARLEELGLKRLELERTLVARRDKVHQIDAEMERIERQIALVRQQIDFCKEQQQRAEREQGELKARANDIERRQQETAERVETLTREAEAAANDLAAKQNEHARAAERVREADQSLESLRAKAVETMNERAKARTAIERIAVELQNIETQSQNIEERERADRERRDSLAARLDELSRYDADQRDALAAVETKRSELTAQETDKASALSKAVARRQALREQKSRIEARLHSLREWRDTYEGFAGGVRAVMLGKQEAIPRLQDVIGPVGDLISTEKNYEKAVEAALGPALNAVIVKTADAAMRAVQYLNESGGGRVTFLPLDILRLEAADGRTDTPTPGAIAQVLEVVRCDDEVRQAVECLLRHFVVVENLDAALATGRGGDACVTLAGEVVATSGAITGGRAKNESAGVLGRKAEIGDLESELERTEADLDHAVQQEQLLTSTVESLRRQLENVGEEETGLRNVLNETGVEMAWQRTERDNLDAALERSAEGRNSLAAKREQLEAERDRALEKDASLEQEEAAVQHEAAEAGKAASEAREALSSRGGELADARVRSAELAQNVEEAKREQERLQQDLDQTLSGINQRTDLVEQLRGNEETLGRDIDGHVARSREFADAREEARRHVVEAENERQAVQDETDALDKTLRDLRARAQAAQSKVHELELALRHDEDQIGFFEERILDDYHIALSSLTAEQVGTDDYDDEAREARIAELRSKIDRMGTVNLMAIEEYEALTERNDFLVAQEEDLRKARESLLNVVTRIDSTIKDMFMETFRMVGESFHTYFRRLFSGGQARIYLLDEDDPLESGIEIEARPPGKKPQSISLLSGGEQALTAIALLFSVFKTKPSPFCILDEVDAPLDDANIGRFLSVLNEFLDQSQFIIITHNKQTMAQADALYGVTMQERGVSQLVSVRFEDVGDAETAA